jgi:hypothetical protein
MTQESPDQPLHEPPPQNPQNARSMPPPPAAPKRRRRRLWPKLVGALVLVLILLIVFAPALAGTAPVRNLILGVVNNNLNGKLEVADWSASWNNGVKIKGLKLRDERGDVVLQASDVTTQLSLWRTLRSGFSAFHLGKTEVQNLDFTKFHIDEDGTPNYAKLAKETAGKKKNAREPSQVEVSGDFHVENMTGTITAANVSQKVYIRPSTIDASLTSLNAPIKHDVRMVFAVDNSAPGTLSSSGEIDLLRNGKVDENALKMKQTLGLSGVDLAILNPFLAMAKNDLKLGGIANGMLDLSLETLDKFTANGEIKIAGFQAAGGPLKGGDVFKSDLAVPIKARRTVENGVEVLRIDDARIVTNYGTVTVQANTSQDAIHNLRNNLPPGSEGKLLVTADFKDAAKLLTSLRNTLQLLPGVQVNSGSLWAQVDASILKDRLVGKTELKIQNLAGVRKDDKTGQAQPIALQPITQSLNLTYVPTGTPSSKFSIGQLRDIAVNFTSAFLTLKGGTGPQGTIAQFNLTGKGDLAKLQQQLGQFFDMGDLKLGGGLDIAASTNGDPNKPDAMVKTNVGVTFTNLSVSGLPGKPPIQQPWLNLTADGNLQLKNNSPVALSGAVFKLQSNNPNQPTVDVLARGDVNLESLTAEPFNLERLRIDLAKARGEFAAFVPALSNFTSGTLTASGAGKYDGKTFLFASQTPLKVVGQNISIQLPKDAGHLQPVNVIKNRNVELTLAGELQRLDRVTSLRAESFALVSPNLFDIRATGGPLAITYQSDPRKIQGNGTLAIFTDVKQLTDILKAMQPPPADGSAPAAPQPIGQLTKGLLNGTLKLARADQPTTTVNGNFTLDVDLTTHKGPLSDKIALTLAAAVPDDMTRQATANLDVKSSYGTAKLADVIAIPANDAFDFLRKATLTVTADRLDALQAIIDSLMPQTTPAAVASSEEHPSARRTEVAEDDAAQEEKPLPPLRVESGSMTLKASLNREGQTTHLRDTVVTLNNVRLWRGDGSFDASKQPINLNLAADIETTPSKSPATAQPSLVEQIQRIQVTQLAGNLSFGQLAMPKPIVITNPGAVKERKVTANGAIELKGNLDRLFRFLEAVGGAKPYSKYPYSGEYVLNQEITTQEQNIRLVGKLDATDFTALDPQKPTRPTFREDQLAVVNDVAADLATSTLALNKVLVDFKSSGALRLTIENGKLIDWADQRQIADKLTATLKTDWGKLWTIVKPMLDAETVADLGNDFRIEGGMERQFTLAGKFPATGKNKRGKVVALPFQASIKQLQATGGLTVPHLYYKGFDARNADIPVILANGIALVQDASKPKGDARIPAPIAVNGGTLDIGGFKLDLTWIDPKNRDAITPLLTIPDRDHVVLKNVNVNPVLADSVIGEYINPAFAGSKEASGTVDLVANYCDRLPLGSAMKQPNAPGSAQFVFSMSKVQLKGEGLSFLTGAIAGGLNQILRATGGSSGGLEGFDSVTGAIQKSTITIERGKITHRLNLETDRFGEWAFDGNLNLASKNFNYLNVKVPTDVFAKNTGLSRYLGDTITFPFAGPVRRPTLAPNFVNKLVEQNLLKNPGNLLEGILGNKNKGRDGNTRDDGAGNDRNRTPADRNRRDNPPAADRRSQSGGNDLHSLFQDFAGDLFDQADLEDRISQAYPPSQRDSRNSRDDRARTAGQRRSANPDDIGNQRISGDPNDRPPSKDSTGKDNVSGDDRISSDPNKPRDDNPPPPQRSRRNRTRQP